MNAHEIQNLTALVGATKRADDSIGKLFDEADCDGEAAVILAGASENIEHVLLSAVYPRLPRACVLLARARRLPSALGGRQAAWRYGLPRGETATRRLTARQSRRDGRAAAARLTARLPRVITKSLASFRAAVVEL